MQDSLDLEKVVAEAFRLGSYLGNEKLKKLGVKTTHTLPSIKVDEDEELFYCRYNDTTYYVVLDRVVPPPRAEQSLPTDINK